MNRNVCIFDHPLIQHKLAIIRNKDTGTKEFREIISEIATQVGFSDSRALAKAFQKKYGMLPSEYNRKNRGQMSKN